MFFLTRSPPNNSCQNHYNPAIAVQRESLSYHLSGPVTALDKVELLPGIFIVVICLLWHPLLGYSFLGSCSCSVCFANNALSSAQSLTLVKPEPQSWMSFVSHLEALLGWAYHNTKQH